MQFAISKPITDISYTYAYRDTAGVWSAEIPVTRGVTDRHKNFVSPQCDELRFTATLGTAQPIDRMHIAGLNILTGLSFDVTIGVSNQVINQNSYTEENELHRQTFRLTETTDTSVVIIITGIAQQKLNLRQLTLLKTAWTPSLCYRVGMSPVTAIQYSRTKTSGSSYQNETDILVNEPFPFRAVSRSEHKALVDLHRYTLSKQNGYCLVEKDITSDLLDDSYLANIQITGQNEQFFDRDTFIVDATEAFRK